MTPSVAGSMASKVWPEAAETHSPPMSILPARVRKLCAAAPRWVILVISFMAEDPNEV